MIAHMNPELVWDYTDEQLTKIRNLRKFKCYATTCCCNRRCVKYILLVVLCICYIISGNRNSLILAADASNRPPLPNEQVDGVKLKSLQENQLVHDSATSSSNNNNNNKYGKKDKTGGTLTDTAMVADEDEYYFDEDDYKELIKNKSGKDSK